jgi:hypothetical protein
MPSATLMLTDPRPARSTAEHQTCSRAAKTASAQRPINRRAELLGGKRLDQSRNELDPKLRELRRRPGNTCADQRQRRIDYASSLREHSPRRRRRLNHQHIGALQLLGRRNPHEHRLVAQSSDHAVKQPPDVIVGLANQYLCHALMIGHARQIPGGQAV